MDNNPKGGELCRRRQVLRKTPSAGSSVTGRLLFYRTSLHHESVDNGKTVRIVAADHFLRLPNPGPLTYSSLMESPQPLSRQAIQEFQAIYEQEFGEPLSDDEAQAMGLRVLRLFAMLAEPEPLAPLTPPSEAS